ncbi:uncharacterized protein B0T15DRAFT_504299 [Chaetomium strumarium]|uniref:Uncharacterized protein n=1 Tax=Chaetomium strumarium TaxID=1170767 RepID=A0AAJ0GN28_9PEZI|nr:hypothetical protein B0T15DRAFT_504299 [Chaetomium strumarium]
MAFSPSDDELPTYETVVGTPATATSRLGEATGDVEAGEHEASTTECSLFIKYGEGWATLSFEMVPDPGIDARGFFWSADNVVPEFGHMFNSVTPRWAAGGYGHARQWTLVDKTCTPDGTPRWVGRLEVMAASIGLLSSFRPQDLSTEHVLSTHAWNKEKQLVYCYLYHVPDQTYNCIYDNKPLYGWWPWPKKGDHQGRMKKVAVEEHSRQRKQKRDRTGRAKAVRLCHGQVLTAVAGKVRHHNTMHHNVVLDLIETVLLRSKGKKAPRWLVRPCVDGVLVFLNLARQITDQPVYALRARGFGMAVTYLAAMKRAQPAGPIHVTPSPVTPVRATMKRPSSICPASRRHSRRPILQGTRASSFSRIYAHS